MGFYDRLKELAGRAQKYSLASLTPDKRVAHCAVRSLALITAADGKVEESEVALASEVIGKDPRITKYIGVTEALEAFEAYVAEVLDSSVAMRPIVVARMVGTIGEHCPAPNRSEVFTIAESMAAADGDVADAEKAILDKLKAALKL